MSGHAAIHTALRLPVRALRATLRRSLVVVRFYPWATATAVVAAIFMLIAVIISWRVGVPIRDPEGSLIGRRMMLPFLFMAIFIVLDVVHRAVRTRRAAGTPLVAAARAEFRERWWWHRIVLAVVGFMSFAISYLGYRNLKSYVSLVDWRTWDPELLQIDRQIFFGHAPAQALHEALGTGMTAQFLSAIYLSYIPLIPISVAAAVTFSGRIRDGYVFVAASIYCWILGTLSYYMVPSLGPFGAAQWQFRDLVHTPVTDVQNALINNRLHLHADPLGYENVASIGGFASLHIAVVFMALIVAWQFRRWLLFAVIAVYLVFTAIATIYFGWHYIVDDIAGLFIGWFSVVSARWTIYPRAGALRRIRRRQRDAPASAQEVER